MKVVLLAAAGCIHTIRWANGLASRGVNVSLISVHELGHELDDKVSLFILKNKAPFGYFSAVFEVRRLLDKIQPDLLNVHYATGYGLLARMAAFKPTLLSVWGSDVYDFPEISFAHRWLLKGNLKSANALASTSNCMARKAAETFFHSSVFITPFGVDETQFIPMGEEVRKGGNEIVIGTVKTLEKVYGIDTLIEAFALVLENVGHDYNLRLEITGGGKDLSVLKGLVSNLGITSNVTFHGEVEHNKVPEMLNRLDIYVALSRFESFGVAILEASSCAKPVVVSDADGPVEVTVNGKTGIIVAKEAPLAASKAIIALVVNRTLRESMGQEGRQHVLDNYTWGSSIDKMISVYSQTMREAAESSV